MGTSWDIILKIVEILRLLRVSIPPTSPHTPTHMDQSFLDFMFFYRPQRSCDQGNIFAPVCHSVHGGGGSTSVHAGIPPPQKQTPPRSRHPPKADTLLPRQQTPLEADTPQEQTPRKQTPPGSRHPPRADTPRESDSGIWSISGRYASFWNAFLFSEHW